MTVSKSISSKSAFGFLIRCILDFAQRHLVDFWKKRPANFSFIWLEWNSYNSSIQCYILWSGTSIFKLKCSLDGGWYRILIVVQETNRTIHLPRESSIWDFLAGNTLVHVEVPFIEQYEISPILYSLTRSCKALQTFTLTQKNIQRFIDFSPKWTIFNLKLIKSSFKASLDNRESS